MIWGDLGDHFWEHFGVLFGVLWHKTRLELETKPKKQIVVAQRAFWNENGTTWKEFGTKIERN